MTIVSPSWVECHRTFIGIAIHNLSASGEGAAEQSDLVAALKGTAAGILGTTAQMADLVCDIHLLVGLFNQAQVIPFVAGGFLYIGAVAVLPTCVHSPNVIPLTYLIGLLPRLLEESRSGKQALREVS